MDVISNRAGQFALQFQNISKLALIALRPQMFFFLGTDQLDCNSQPIFKS